MQTLIGDLLTSSAAIKKSLAADQAFLAQAEKAAQQLLKTIREGGTIYSCGNGGSSCDAMHFTEEMVARFNKDRPGVKAVHMQDPGVLTCWSNDYSYETVFERYVQTFCEPGDTLIAISTSGNSKNILNALRAGRQKGVFRLGLTGKDGGAMKELCDLALVVPAREVERIQEVHITLLHIFCQIIDQSF